MARTPLTRREANLGAVFTGVAVIGEKLKQLWSQQVYYLSKAAGLGSILSMGLKANKFSRVERGSCNGENGKTEDAGG